MTERYGITYNFNPNYKTDIADYYNTYDCTVFNAICTNGKVSSAMRELTMFRVHDNKYSLERGEIVLGSQAYTALFKTKLTEEQIANFQPVQITISQYESEAETQAVISKTVTLKAIEPNSSSIKVNDETFRDFMDFDIYTYSVYLDDPSKADEAIKVVDQEHLEICSAKVSGPRYVERCIEVFGKFLKITMVFVLIAAIIFLVKFGVKSIRSNIYEIGVIKAMGGMRGDISKIFISQSLLVGIGILAVTYLGMHIGAFVADKIFIASLEMAIGAHLYGIKTVAFYPGAAFIVLVISLLVILVSAVISTKSIDKLNLISILKAKE